MTEPARLPGAVLGFVLAGLPGVLLVLLAEAVNPAFVDEPLSLWAVLIAMPGLFGAAAGALLRARPRRWTGGVAVGTAAVLVALSIGPRPAPMSGLRLVVVGIDGATWDQVERLDLPNLHALREEGASGTLRAHEPLFSPLLWTTMASGVSPAEHGVHGFHVHADDCRVPRFFDIAEAEGHRLGLYKWLVTWPPRDLPNGGFLVPGWLAPSPETAPPALSFVKELELSRRLARRQVGARRSPVVLALAGIRHGFRWSTVRDAGRWWVTERLSRPSHEERLWKLNLLRGRMDRDVFLAALREHQPGVATFTYYATDAVSHGLWRYHEPDAFPGTDPADVARYGRAVGDVYRQADAILGEIRQALPDDARLLVVSDHGFQALDAARDGAPVAPRTEALEAYAEAAVGPVQVARVGTRVTVSLEGDVSDRLDRLAVALDALVRADGAPMFRYAPVEEDPASLVLDLLDGRARPDALDEQVGGLPLDQWVRTLEGHSGDHTPWGIFVAAGSGVRPGARVDVDLLDVAPIALAALGLPKSEAMIGSVPAGLWAEVGAVASWQQARDGLRFPASGDEVNAELLEALGYVDGGE